MSRRTVHVDEHFGSDEVSAQVQSSREIFVERAMYFDYLGAYDGGSCEHGTTAARGEWYLAEGYTAQSFDTWILVYNPGGSTAHVTMDLLREDGRQGKLEMEVAAGARSTASIDSLEGFSSCSFSTRITSDQPVVVERSMFFDSQGRKGGHVALGSPDLSSAWNFAEGYTSGSFDTWVLVGNPRDEGAHVRFHLYVPGGNAEKTVEADVAPHSRYTLHVDDHLPDSEVAVFVESDRPVVAERAMYFNYYGKDDGSCVMGAPQAYARWYLAEGYTGGDFDQYVLVGNPGDQPAQVKFSFLTQGGLAGERTYDLAPRSRFTVHVDDILPADEVSVIVEETGGRGIMVERAMYFNYYGRKGGHAAFGVPQASGTWYLAEGYTGG
jgi:hypothetical protein